MKKFLALTITILMIVSLFGFSISAEEEDSFYEWNFNKTSSSDNGDDTITADVGDNSLLYTAAGDYKFPNDCKGYSLGYVEANGKLSGMGGYFELENPINLASNKAWAIEIAGRLPNYTHLFSKTNTGGDGNYIMIGATYPLMNAKGLTSSFNTVENGRLGQGYIQKFRLWNEFNDDKGIWEIHFSMEKYGGSAIRGEGSYTVTGVNGTSKGSLGLVINYIGTKLKPFQPNSTSNTDGSTNYYDVYLDYLRIWENTDELAYVPEIKGNVFTEPKANGYARSFASIDNTEYYSTDEKVQWTNSFGVTVYSFQMGENYTASIRLVPINGFAFSKTNTIIPDYYDYIIDEADGSLILSRTFTVTESVEDEFKNDEDLAEPYEGGEEIEDPGEGEKGGALSGLTISLVCICAVLAAGLTIAVVIIIKSKKKN